jgi:hypothetical protein
MAIDPGLIGPSTLAITQGLSSMQAFLPKLSDVRRADPKVQVDIAADVRLGIIAMGAMTVGTGVIVSSLTGSSVPALTGVVVTVMVAVMYESALNANRPFEKVA